MNSNENINISQICRTCFLENKDHKFLNDPEEKIDDRTLEEVFYDVVKVEMDENIKAVANRICLNCSNDLINAYNFIQMSLYNNERLTKILKRLDIKPTNIATDFKTDDSNHQNSIDSIKIEQESLQDYNSSMEYENSTENSSSSEAPNNKIKKQKLQCSACNKVFNYPHLYERHLTTHTEANRKAKNIGEQQSATCENNLTDQSNIEMGNQIKTSEERKRNKRWTYEETKALLHFYLARKKEFNMPRKRRIAFQNVVKDMVSAGYDSEISSYQCEIKITTLLRAYKSAKNNASRMGASPFFTEMNEIFGDKANQSSGAALNLETEFLTAQNPEISFVVPTTSGSKTSLENNDTILCTESSREPRKLSKSDYFKAKLKAAEERHQQRQSLKIKEMEAREKRFNIKKSLIEKILDQ